MKWGHGNYSGQRMIIFENFKFATYSTECATCLDTLIRTICKLNDVCYLLFQGTVDPPIVASDRGSSNLKEIGHFPSQKSPVLYGDHIMNRIEHTLTLVHFLAKNPSLLDDLRFDARQSDTQKHKFKKG